MLLSIQQAYIVKKTVKDAILIKLQSENWF